MAHTSKTISTIQTTYAQLWGAYSLNQQLRMLILLIGQIHKKGNSKAHIRI